VFQGLGTHIGLVADAAQNCGKNMSEENILDLQSTLYGVFNHVLTKITNREIPPANFVSTPLLLQDSTDESVARPSKKPKTADVVPFLGETSPSPTHLINFSHAAAMSFLSKKYPEKNTTIIENVARILCSGNQELMLCYVVKNNGNYHRGFKQNPARSLNEEQIKNHHLQCAWSLLSGCAVIPEPDEAFSLFYNEGRRVSKKTKSQFGSFFFNTKQHVWLIAKPAVKTAFLQLAKKEVEEFKSKIEADSENEDSENDDFMVEASEELDVGLLGLDIEPGEEEEEEEEEDDEEEDGNEKAVNSVTDTLDKRSAVTVETPSEGAEPLADKLENEGEPRNNVPLISAGDEDIAEQNKTIQENGTSSPSPSRKKQKVTRLSSLIQIET
jgi:hypothetical protein